MQSVHSPWPIALLQPSPIAHDVYHCCMVMYGARVGLST